MNDVEGSHGALRGGTGVTLGRRIRVFSCFVMGDLILQTCLWWTYCVHPWGMDWRFLEDYAIVLLGPVGSIISRMGEATQLSTHATLVVLGISAVLLGMIVSYLARPRRSTVVLTIVGLLLWHGFAWVFDHSIAAGLLDGHV